MSNTDWIYQLDDDELMEELCRPTGDLVSDMTHLALFKILKKLNEKRK